MTVLSEVQSNERIAERREETQDRLGLLWMASVLHELIPMRCL